MKSLSLLTILCVSLTLSYNVHAIDFAVIGPCSEKSTYSGKLKADLDDSVGEISMQIFDHHKIPYQGSADGMSTIMNGPVGLDAMEVISDTKMRAYGWCFSVNGVIPDVLASQTHFTKQSDYLVWFYAYSTYDQGVWTDYCVPSYKIKAEQFCKKP
jgi:hypothetical protein